jgi:hypothetical protein
MPRPVAKCGARLKADAEEFGRDRGHSGSRSRAPNPALLTLSGHSTPPIVALQNDCCFASSNGERSELAQPSRPFSHDALNSDRLSDAHVRRNIGHCRPVSSRQVNVQHQRGQIASLHRWMVPILIERKVG